MLAWIFDECRESRMPYEYSTCRNQEEFMAENRKYYFLKLKEDFFEQDAIVLLESLKA